MYLFVYKQLCCRKEAARCFMYVVSFNSTKRRVESFIVSTQATDLSLRAVKCAVLLSLASVRPCRVARLLTRPAGRVGSGRVRKFTGKGGSGRVGSGRVGSTSARDLNLILKCLDICILFCSLHNVPAVYSVSPVQFSVYIRRCGG